MDNSVGVNKDKIQWAFKQMNLNGEQIAVKIWADELKLWSVTDEQMAINV